MLRRVLTLFIILAGVSISLMIRDRHSQGRSELADSLASDRISLSAAAPSSRAGGGGLGAADREKLRILDEILKANNDNDPRMDRELRLLSDPLKSAVEARYQGLPIESRDERGMVVLLIGRNLSRPEDFAFLSTVLREPRCLSLADCKTPPAWSGVLGESDQALAYPQWVALRFLERELGGPFEASAVEALQTGLHSPNPAVAQRAAELLRRVVGHG